jgi:mannose-6-phosphate isomerase class I
MKANDTRKATPVLMPLRGSVQHYEWGGYGFIPVLLGLRNEEKKPFAELWLGTHPKSPASVEISGELVSLEDVVRQVPEEILGPAVSARFQGRLPYLLKVLDARKMLSIQAHPNKRQAEEGFARESAAGISLRSAHRNYRDANHKPEVHVALTEFWMLHGFRPLEQIAGTFKLLPELAPIMPDLDRRLIAAGDDGESRRSLLRELYGPVMLMPQLRVDTILRHLIRRLEREESADRNDHNFWALRAAHSFPLPGGHYDRGILCIYLLNLLHLQPGQGTFQPAGVLHAYLEGTTVELMANSDNVLRGGLTPKYVDVEELMRTLSFESGIPAVLHGETVSSTETAYRTSAEEFELSRIELDSGEPHVRKARHGPDIIVVLSGSAWVRSEPGSLLLKRGESALAPDALAYTLESQTDRAMVFRASVPGFR